MKTNLIQNYISPPISNGHKDPKEFNINDELANKTFIKPLPGKGRLVKANLFDSPGIMVKSLAYDLKSLKNGIGGHANDHELGKLNDVGMKLGGLAIASYLFTKRIIPTAKGMEFIGPITFFASMAIWPKIAIQLPALLVHGQNVHKKYEDSFGRKKLFYQDPQFTPWDLYTDKQLENREKKRKIAIQNNTLWMMTAGVATPVMSGLMCNALTPYLLKVQDKRKNAYADKLIDKAPDYVEKFKKTDMVNNIETFIKLYKDKPLTNPLFEQLSSYITTGIDPITSNGIKSDLRNLLMIEKYSINKNTANDIVKNAQEFLLSKEFAQNIVDKIVPNENEIIKIFQENKVIDKVVTTETTESLYTKIGELIKNKIKAFNLNKPEGFNAIDAKSHKLREVYGDVLSGSIKSSRATLLDKTSSATIRNIAKIMTDFNAKRGILNKYAYIKTADAPETAFANYWNGVNKTILKELNITDKELEINRHNPDAMTKILRTKLENIAANESEYKKFTSELCAKISQVPKVDFAKYNELSESIYNEAANKFKELKMFNTVENLIGKSKTGENGQIIKEIQGSLLHVQKDFLEYRLRNVSTFNRFLNLLDYLRRVSTGTNINALDGIAKEIKEEHIEHTLKSLLSGHPADFAVKLPMKRNPNSNKTDFGPLTLENGKVKYQYFNPNSKNMVEIADNGGHFFRQSIRLAFENELHPDSVKIYQEYSLFDSMKNYRKTFIENVANSPYYVKLQKMMETIYPVEGQGRMAELGRQISNEVNFQLIGKAPDELISNASIPLYNTKKWLGLFGKIGIGLFAATVLLQFTFGKMKTPKQQKTGVDKNA